jgi:hypothetical protein
MTEKAFNRIELAEALEIAGLVSFDIADRGLRAGCCAGPGGEYLCRDKRYVVTKLLAHLDDLHARGAELPARAQDFREKARTAVDEYRAIEKRLGRIVERGGKPSP